MYRLLSAIAVSSVLLSACSATNTTVPAATTPLTFPVHANFERNGRPSLNSWTFHPVFAGDTATFDNDAPNGATYSLKLHKSDLPPATNNVTESFSNLASGIYRLTAWTKIKYRIPAPLSPEAWGWVTIVKKSGGISTEATAPSGDSLAWHPVSVTDTLQLLPADSVTIELSSGACDTMCHGNPVWFDDITFEKVQ